MTANESPGEQVEELLAVRELAGALETERFKHLLDQIPMAAAVSVVENRSERIVYATPAFERLSGLPLSDLKGSAWTVLHHRNEDDRTDRYLGAAVVQGTDHVGTFRVEPEPGAPQVVDAHANVIHNDDGTPAFRLVSLVHLRPLGTPRYEELEKLAREKDTLLREIQHRVKNNLQMITALIRLEARNLPPDTPRTPFDRLAGRVEALQILYASLSDDDLGCEVDLGVYVSQIASAVMRSHAVDGIRLDLKADAYPVSVNVAMPTGLVVNELMTNALKHAFHGREGGTITVHCLAEDHGCRVIVADDGIGMPDNIEWPEPGKLGALIVQALRENAKVRLELESETGKGTRAIIALARTAAAPQATE